MDSTRWERVRSIFADALNHPDGDRDRFVRAEACDDPSLIDDVESLLASHRAAEGFLEGRALDVAPPPGLSDYLPSGHVVGAYRLIRPVGRGGMGAVYLAERADDQYHKLVAIKVVARGLDTDAIVRRFRRERQILADLDHPNIARLLEGGATSDGLPYFVMEYIDGVPITTYCESHALSVNERLDLFRSVCAAVEYAHQRLIVHCDIKPGNILVTNDGSAKLLDFGIASLVGVGPDDAGVSHTRALTAGYASPEQIEGSAVTTLTDVYSLGVVLYELLSGSSPFARQGRALLPFGPPGAKRTDSIAPPSEVAENRLLRGDLDAIVLKAIAPAPENRYATVQLFGDDVRNFLRRHPVLAREQTVSYRMGKLVRRNALASAAVVVLALSLLGGITATSWQAHLAEQQRSTADRRFKDIRTLALSLISEVNDSIAALPGTVSARKLVVVRALASLDALARDARGDQGLQQDLADAYIKVGDIQGHPYRPNLGDTRAAMQSYARANRILALVNQAAPHNPRTLEALAIASERLGAVSLRARDWKRENSSNAQPWPSATRCLRPTPPTPDIRRRYTEHSSILATPSRRPTTTGHASGSSTPARSTAARWKYACVCSHATVPRP